MSGLRAVYALSRIRHRQGVPRRLRRSAGGKRASATVAAGDASAMKWSQIPLLIVALIPACSLMTQNDAFYLGAAQNGGAAGAPVSEGAGDGGNAADAGSTADAGTAGIREAAGDSSAAAGASGSTSDCDLPPISQQSEACGPCGAGVRTRMLMLMDGCSYAVSDWSACDGQAACTAGQVETAKQPCGACGSGTQTRSRTCSETCAWGAWNDWGACGGVTAACTPGQTTSCPNGDSCGERVCSSTCTWGGCVPKIAGGCLRIGPGHTDEGSNFHCCGSGKWQFCLSTCHWSSSCESCGSGCDC